MSSPLVPGRTYDVTFDADAEESADELSGLIYEDALDGFYIFCEPAPDLSEDPGGAILSNDGVGIHEAGERIFLNRGWIRKIREHRCGPIATPPEQPVPAEATVDCDEDPPPPPTREVHE